ncbi:MDR family MFS transporter [Desulfoferrobacter suflitae]|uniref:MDR family MFS transporter n=1 Tax=Desulfoferrobacter suflitae TaxID=2865782 RepID=UPI00216415D6|nr:MFS transporter [Desulfoferrobacter suflitae]MCK8601626.1 MFS transporter [Desulfoferrobacter suflitae]
MGLKSYESFLGEARLTAEEVQARQLMRSRKKRVMVVSAALLALFLGALDALVVGAAMPTIVSELGGLHLYSWVFSSYLLTRAISLPVFGKLCDLLSSRKLYLFAISVFLVSSVLAGAAHSMTQLIFFRALQGIGAGGNFALAYIVIADLSAPVQRGKMMGLVSFVWGIASVLGPALGGFIVTYFSWRWIFYINVPLGAMALLGIGLYLTDLREKKQEVAIDYLGAAALSVLVLTLLVVFMLGGRSYAWMSPQILGILVVAVISGVLFWAAEVRAREPILDLKFFRIRGFSVANGAAFFSSFAIFSLSAYMPLFIQGALGRTPAQLGLAMIPLSLGWSGGALVCGQLINRAREKPFSLFGAILLMTGAGIPLIFAATTPLWVCSIVLAIAGLGMGFVSLGTLLMVQNSLKVSDLGVATSSHQFSRTLGGTIGIGVAGSLVSTSLAEGMAVLGAGGQGAALLQSLPRDFAENIQSLFQPHIQALMSEELQGAFRQAIAQGVEPVFLAALAASGVSLLFSCLLPQVKRSSHS